MNDVNSILTKGFRIGICDSRYNRTDNVEEFDGTPKYCWQDGGKIYERKNGYHYDTFEGDEVNRHFGRGDVISLRLDTKKGEIEFYIQSRKLARFNKGRQKCGYFSIIQRDDLSYKLAASIWYNNDHISIEKFEITKA